MSPTVEFTVFKGSPSGHIVETKTRLDAPSGKQVLLRITHSGICGTDEHYKTTDMVLGHEGVGIVEAVGEAVTRLKVGDVVGWGYMHKTCGECESCLKGQDQYCTYREWYGTHNFHQGSFGSHAIWDDTFLFKIPPALAPELAAPLMCSGSTTFGVIEAYNIRPTDRVGVIGVGGLGHLAIQFLAKMGSEVVVFSSSDSKKEEATRLGAKEFHATKGVEKFENVKPLDHLIITTSFLTDWKPFVQIMKNEGSIYPITISGDDLVVPILPIVLAGIRIQGTVIASRAVTLRMLDFAARNGIAPIIETFPMTKAGVEEGMQKLRDGKMRYRGVLVAQ
ncbi:putative NADP-dependent alcohol dehydrogenase C 2 [Mycena amicta]|nr:putative NADP-dependent alcohol dehydrogenase C 2 [Mycena amicta]